MAKQSSIYTFFSKSQNKNTPNGQEASQSNVKLKGKSVSELDLVWAKLDGYPWWPALVCACPGGKEFIRQTKIHVQFFDYPPTRGWVRDILVKPYCAPEEVGIPNYKISNWAEAVKECNMAQELEKKDRKSLIVEMVPSDEEETLEDMEEDSEDESDRSKENVSENISHSKHRKRSLKKSDGKQEKKRRRIILCSDSESEDDYKPGKESESDDESGSSGVDEDQVSGPETGSEVDSPVKTPKMQRKKPAVVKSDRIKSLSNSPSVSSPSTPKVSAATKSTLAIFSAKENSGGDGGSGDGSSEDWPFLHYQWLKPGNIKDRNQRSPGHPDYDKRTLYVPEPFLNQQTPGMRQWWELKSRHYDTVLFFKMGKFYELFHMDAVLGVQELGLLMMKGDNAHAGFPEIAYGRYSSTLIDKGYKVARIEQTETPEMMEKRCKSLGRTSKFDRVVRREICQVTSQATRVYSFLDGEDTQAATSHLLALTERGVMGTGDGNEFGVAFVDTSTAQFYVGQFKDDCHLSRLRTLLSHYPVAQILTERGRLSQKTQSLVNATVPQGLRETLVPEKEFWNSSKTLTFLADGPYFRVEQQQTDKMEEGEGKGKTTRELSLQWPEDLKLMIDDGDSLGLTARAEYEMGVSALGALVWYLQECRLDEQLLTRHMLQLYQPPDQHSEASADHTTATLTKHHMVLDGTTLRNLEVFENSIGGTEGTLLDRLDHCSTPFGKRLLRNWLCSPLCQTNSIKERLKAITDLRHHPDALHQATQILKTLPDLERILAKVHTQGLKRQSSHPDTRAIYFEDIKYNKRKVVDFLAALNGMKDTLKILASFNDVRTFLTSKLLRACVTTKEDGGNFPMLTEALNFFDNAFDHSEAEREGKIIPCPGVDAEYDEAVTQIKVTKDKLAAYLQEQCSHFGTKVVYWGSDKKRYQLEVPDHACRKAGEEYEPVSQKKGYKRYWTPETREMLADMMAAEEQRNSALRDIARRIFHQFDEYHEKWEAVVQCMSVLDVLASLTQYSQEANTIMPEVINPKEGEESFLEIRDGLHPCVVSTYSGEEFIPNDVVLGTDSTCALTLVTGPNMGGKSTLMRQTALICILAQLGSYVPASSCRLTPVDRVFTRLGTSDRIMLGESTFMVELTETASIIQHATPHSLVLVDELGRGTASYDGMAIASGVVQALVERGCRTLFSTHYHALVDSFTSHHNVSLGHMACMVEDENDDDPSQETITFLYKFTEGACPKSYGFNAARLADLPDQVIRRGSHKARELEKSSVRKQTFRKLFCGMSDGPKNLRDCVKSIQDVQ